MRETSRPLKVMGVAIGYVTSIVATRAATFHGVDARGHLTGPAVYRIDDPTWRAEDVLAALDAGCRDGAAFSLAALGATHVKVIDREQLRGVDAAAADRQLSVLLAPQPLELHAMMLLRDELRLVGAISLLRAFDQPPLTHAQRTLLQLSHDLIEQAYTAARAMPQAAGDVDPLHRHDLTRREIEVAQLAGAGATNSEIAQRLRLSSATVKTHLNRAFMKLGIRSRTQLSLLIADRSSQSPYT